MNPAVLEKLKALASETLYRQLVSTEKSEDYAIEFLRLRIGKRREAYNEAKKISDYFAEILAKKRDALSKNMTEVQKKKITRESLDEVAELYSKGGGNGGRS